MGMIGSFNKKIFSNTILFLIVLITCVNIALVTIFSDLFNSYSQNIKLIIGISIILTENIILLFFINIFYKKPIATLVHNIKKALLTKESISLQKSINPDITYINSFFLQFLNSFKNIKTDFLKGKEIKGEVELAKDIQEKLLHKKINQPPSLNIVARSKPMGEIGGDSYDVIQSGDNYYMYVGDATGHGVGAGFIMVMVNALISSFAKVFISGAQILIRTNEVLKPRVKANLLMTMLLVRWNENDKKLYMTGAGHEHLIIFNNKLQRCFKVKSGGLALGMVKDIDKMIKEQGIKFEEKDVLILYSDGVTDSINSSDTSEIKERFGETRLIQAIETAPRARGKEYKTSISVFNNITIELSKFMGYKHSQVDDITLATIQYKAKDYDINSDYSEDISSEFITEWNW